MDKPFSEACERNKGPILEVLRDYISIENKRLLEIGTGSGQHAVAFAKEFPWLEWYPSDKKSVFAGMRMWFEESRLRNIQQPIPFEVGKDDFPKLMFDAVFTANTLHIMAWKECKTLIKMLGHRLRENALVFFYGPFNYNGTYTSPSNESFDKMLKERDPSSGIRAFEDVNNNMVKQGFELIDDHEMPANNRLLVYRRLKFVSQR